MMPADDMPRNGDPGNPFPSTPAVQLRVPSPRGRAAGMAPRPPVSIDTRAGDALRAQIGEYLRSPEETGSRGRAFGIVGNLGLGKTHLAQDVTLAVGDADAAIPMWSITQPSRDMGAVYRDQITAIYEDRDARLTFESVVEAFHAHVTATALEEDRGDLPESDQQVVVRQLRNEELDSRKVVQILDIDEEMIHRHLRRQLRETTGHRQFATALALLLDRRFNRDVWDWLTGKEPAEILRERGIITPITGISGVLEALTVFGFLHGQVGRRYVLVVDALETVLDWGEGEKRDFLNGLEWLVNTYVNRGGLVVLCVLAERWSALPPGLHERVLQIWPDRLDRRQTQELVAAYTDRHRELHGGDPGPLFTPGALDQLADLGDGIPRQVLKISRRAWELRTTTRDGRPLIDHGVVHNAVRALNEQRALPDVYDVVEKVLAAGQWPREDPPAPLAATGADRPGVRYWVPVGDRDAIAIVVLRSVLLDAEVREIDALAQAARAHSGGGCRTLVLVNGTVSRAMRDRIIQYLGTTPLLVGDPHFPEQLGEAVTLLADRLLAVRQRGSQADLWERVDSMAAQQAAFFASLRQPDGTPALERAPRPDPAAGPGQLPADVAARFDAARDALDILFEPPPALARAFTLDIDPAGRPVPSPHPGRFAFDQRQMASLGLLAAVDRLVAAFRDGVTGWWQAADRPRDGSRPEWDDGLATLCRNFEISMEVLPVPDPAGPSAGTATALRRAEARDLLNGLAEAVRDGLLHAAEAVTPAAEPPSTR